jgi:hypothetical protein
MTKADILERAARAVVRSADHEASFYEAQTPVEDWALDALDAALSGDPTTAERLLDQYENVEWELRREYVFSDLWDEECRTTARTANVP